MFFSLFRVLLFGLALIRELLVRELVVLSKVSILLAIVILIIARYLSLSKVLPLKYHHENSIFIDEIGFDEDQYLLNLVNYLIFLLEYAHCNSFKTRV